MDVYCDQKVFEVLAAPLWGNPNNTTTVRVKLQKNGEFTAELYTRSEFWGRRHVRKNINLWKQLGFQGEPPSSRDDLFQVVAMAVGVEMDFVIFRLPRQQLNISIDSLLEMSLEKWPVRYCRRGNQVDLVVGAQTIEAVLRDIPQEPAQGGQGVCRNDHIHPMLCGESCLETGVSITSQNHGMNILIVLSALVVATCPKPIYWLIYWFVMITLPLWFI